MAVLMAVVNNQPKPLAQLNPAIPAALADLIACLLAKKPEDRPASAAQIAQTLEATAAELGLVLTSASSTWSKHGAIRFMNPVAERLTGWTAAQAAGHQSAEVLKLEYSLVPDEVAHQRLAHGNIALEGALISKQGIEIPVEERRTAIHDDEGRVVGTVMAIRDISERRRAEIQTEILLGFAIEDEERDLVGELRIYRKDAASRLYSNRASVETGSAKIGDDLIDVLRFKPQTNHSFARRIDASADEPNLGAADFHRRRLPVGRSDH